MSPGLTIRQNRSALVAYSALRYTHRTLVGSTVYVQPQASGETDTTVKMANDLLLASDSLASFLRELDDLDDHTTHASAASHSLDSPVSLSGAVLPPPETKQRAFTPAETHTSATARSKPRHGDRVKKLRTEIRSLYQQLRRLQHIPSRGAADSSWKRRAACERLARDQAEYDNAQLKQRLLEDSKLCHEVKRLLLKQRVQLPRSRAEATYSLVNDDTHMFGRLQADLSRRQHQLELSMQHRVREITQRNLLGEFRQDKWNIVARGRSLHVDVVESVLLPFNASMVNAIISQYTQSGSVQAAGDNVRLRCLPHNATLILTCVLVRSLGRRQSDLGRHDQRCGATGSLLWWETPEKPIHLASNPDRVRVGASVGIRVLLVEHRHKPVRHCPRERLVDHRSRRRGPGRSERRLLWQVALHPAAARWLEVGPERSARAEDRAPVPGVPCRPHHAHGQHCHGPQPAGNSCNSVT